MAKPAAATKKAQEEPAALPKKSNKKLILIIVAVALLVGGGVAAFFLLKPPAPKHGDANKEEAKETHPEVPAKFVDLGQFTANLMHEDEDRYIQVAISLKISKPELEEKIKESKPEILHRVNMLLQSKKPSELSTFEGKEKLAEQIKVQTEFVLGLRKTVPVIGTMEPAVSGVGASTTKSGVTDVLFTSFIIQ